MARALRTQSLKGERRIDTTGRCQYRFTCALGTVDKAVALLQWIFARVEERGGLQEPRCFNAKYMYPETELVGRLLCFQRQKLIIPLSAKEYSIIVRPF